MGIKIVVVGSHLVVAYKEIKLFGPLPQVYPQDFADFLLRNHFRFYMTFSVNDLKTLT